MVSGPEIVHDIHGVRQRLQHLFVLLDGGAQGIDNFGLRASFSSSSRMLCETEASIRERRALSSFSVCSMAAKRSSDIAALLLA
jgi:hypothetical protein